MKKITVIICNYNNEKYLEKCLKSICNQSVTKRAYSILFIDDCSTDNSIIIAKKYLNFENFKIIKNNKNIGLVKSCNKAIKLCKTKYIIRIDSDDYVKKNFIEKFNLSTKKDYDFIFSNYLIMKKNKFFKINLKKKKFKSFNLLFCCFKKSTFKKSWTIQKFFLGRN